MPGPISNSRATIQSQGEAQATGDDSRSPNGVAPDPLAGSPAAAEGRRILSTAFVRIGPDGHLTVDLQDGRVLVLRDVSMGPRDYCGVRVVEGRAGERFCGGYAQVAAARPGGGPGPQEQPQAVANLAK